MWNVGDIPRLKLDDRIVIAHCGWGLRFLVSESTLDRQCISFDLRLCRNIDLATKSGIEHGLRLDMLTIGIPSRLTRPDTSG